jgi:hypothetical protein
LATAAWVWCSRWQRDSWHGSTAMTCLESCSIGAATAGTASISVPQTPLSDLILGLCCNAIATWATHAVILAQLTGLNQQP